MHRILKDQKYNIASRHFLHTTLPGTQVKALLFQLRMPQVTERLEIQQPAYSLLLSRQKLLQPQRSLADHQGPESVRT